MAKCIIVFEDEGDQVKVGVNFEPPHDTAESHPTYAQRVGWAFFKEIQKALEVPDTELQDAPAHTPEG